MSSVSPFCIDDDDVADVTTNNVFDTMVDDDTTGALPLSESIQSVRPPRAENTAIPVAATLAKVPEDRAAALDSTISNSNNTSFETTVSSKEHDDDDNNNNTETLSDVNLETTEATTTTLEEDTAMVEANNNNVKDPSDLAYHSEILDLKLKRKRRTAALGVVGGVAGLLLLGPIGGIAVGASAAIITKTAGKRKEKKKRKELEKKRQVEEAMEEAEASFVQSRQQQAQKNLGNDEDNDDQDDSTITTSSSSHSLTPANPASSSSSSVGVE